VIISFAKSKGGEATKQDEEYYNPYSSIAFMQKLTEKGSKAEENIIKPKFQWELTEWEKVAIELKRWEK